MANWGLAGASLILAAALAASPVTLSVGIDGPAFVTGYAQAKHGRDDRADDRGRGRGRDDRGGDDRGGRGRGGDDRGGDDRGGDDRPAGGGASKPGGGVVKVEREGRSIEVVWGNGVKEEIEAGWYERKNAAGDTVVERRATPADRQRLRAIAER